MISLKFKGQWRDYQKDVLKNLEHHLGDRKLHVVAAPGAGKTILGIEVIARLGQNVLIFAPTLTIRNQWKERIISSFLSDETPDLISLDIKNPKPITITTYQSLWAAFSGNKEADEPVTDEEDVSSKTKDCSAAIIKKLKAQNIGVFCFDEAHHLKNEWWKALFKLMDKVPPKQTIALTATPPYDVSYYEWQRYEELCGPIDESISIPALVKNGDLCPHQDFVYLSTLKPVENEAIQVFETNVQTFMDFLMNDTVLQQMLLNLDLFTNPEKYLENIFENPDFFMSVAAYLNAAGCVVPKSFLKLFDMNVKEIPVFDETFAELFLNGLLDDFRTFFKPLNEQIKVIEQQLRGKGIAVRGKVNLSSNPVLRREIASSIGKLDSIVDIVQSEQDVLKSDLRLVVLADYIRENETEESADALGVVPIFLKINREVAHIPAAVLTGSLVVIPATAKGMFLEKMKGEKLKVADVKFAAFRQNNNLLKVSFSESCKDKIVKMMTDLFADGVFQVLVGTQALLGEGWDAPCINTLILSSTISSYVSSNQMRGRAIRKDKNNPNKIANIWHLASVKERRGFAVKIQSDLRVERELNTFDMEQITRRFEGYEAPSVFKPFAIQNGLYRLGLGRVTETRVAELNAQTKALSRDRAQTAAAWQNGLLLGNAGVGRMRSGIEPNKGQRSFVFKGSFLFLLLFYLTISMEMYSVLYRIQSSWALPITVLFAVYFIWGPLVKLIKSGSVVGSLQSVFEAVLNTLAYAGEVQTPLQNVHILIKKDLKGQIFCSVSGLLVRELNVTLKAVQEILNPIDNPRYVLVRRGAFWGVAQKDYHAVPTLIGTQKKYVDYFVKQWNKKIGTASAVYTRSTQGRRFMLKTRKRAFSDSVQTQTLSKNKWC